MAVMPDISVLLPVRDGAPFLEEALRSILDQTWSDLEVVAVDDGDAGPGAEDQGPRPLVLRQARELEAALQVP